MASHESALKKYHRDQKRRARNRAHRSRLRTEIKKIRAAIAGGEAETARGMLLGTYSVIDRSATVGVIHPNNAARTKSRITRAVEALEAKGA